MKILNAALALLATMLLAIAIGRGVTVPEGGAWDGLWGAVLQALVALGAAIFAAMAFMQLRRQVDGEERRHAEDRYEQALALLRFLRDRGAETLSDALKRVARIDAAIADHDANPDRKWTLLDHTTVKVLTLTLHPVFLEWSARRLVSPAISADIESLVRTANSWNDLVDTDRPNRVTPHAVSLSRRELEAMKDAIEAVLQSANRITHTTFEEQRVVMEHHRGKR